MKREIEILKDFIETNLIEKSNDQDINLKGVYIGEPYGVYSFDTPAVYLIPSRTNSISGQYVGEDTRREQIAVRFYVDGARPMGATNNDPTPKTMELIELSELFVAYARQDPTFNSRYVNSEVSNVTYMTAQNGDTNVYRIAEITLNVVSRRLWNMNGITDQNNI